MQKSVTVNLWRRHNETRAKRSADDLLLFYSVLIFCLSVELFGFGVFPRISPICAVGGGGVMSEGSHVSHFSCLQLAENCGDGKV